MFILSTIIWTIGEILVVTNFGVYLANHSPSNFRARFNAIGSLSWSIGAALGTSVAGKFVQEFSLNSLWFLTFVLSLIGTVGMLLILVFQGKGKKIAVQEVKG
jgi:MFS family permease